MSDAHNEEVNLIDSQELQNETQLLIVRVAQQQLFSKILKEIALPSRKNKTFRPAPHRLPCTLRWHKEAEIC
jgi:hypothetical protein